MIAARSAVRRVPGTPAASRSGSRASNPARSAARASDRVGTHLPGPDPVHLLDRDDPDLAVPDLAGPGRGEDGVDDGLGLVVFDHDLHLDLRDEVHLILGAPVDLGVPALPPEPLRLDGREPRHAHLAQGLLDVVQTVRLHHRDDELHGDPKRTRPIGREPGPATPRRPSSAGWTSSPATPNRRLPSAWWPRRSPSGPPSGPPPSTAPARG